MDLLERAKKKLAEQEAKKRLEVVPEVALKTIPKKKTRPKPAKKPAKPIVAEPVVVRKEKIGAYYYYKPRSPETIQKRMELVELEYERNRRVGDIEFFKRRQKARLMYKEMVNKEYGLPPNFETQYRIETGCRPLYCQKPTDDFFSWLSRRLTTKQKRKYMERYDSYDDVSSFEEAEESEESEEKVEEEEETKKTEARAEEQPEKHDTKEIKALIASEVRNAMKKFNFSRPTTNNNTEDLGIIPIKTTKMPIFNPFEADKRLVVKELKGTLETMVKNGVKSVLQEVGSFDDQINFVEVFPAGILA